MFSFLKARIRSFANALNGIAALVRSEVHAKIHLLATILVILLSIYLELSRIEFLLILVAIGLVWICEAINTAIEETINLIQPNQHPIAGKIKDIAAGAVLFAAILAAIIGICILGPPLYQLIFS
jgi:diacylglycerol kinase